MSDLDVHRIICPSVERDRDRLRVDIKAAEEHVLFLRKAVTELVEHIVREEGVGPDHRVLINCAGAIAIQAMRHEGLPHYYDGTGWAMLQQRAENL